MSGSARRSPGRTVLRRAGAAVVVLVLVAVVVTPGAGAAVTIYEGDKGKVDLELRFMFWGMQTGRELFGASQDDRVDDFFVRRARIIVLAKLSEKLSAYLQIGQDNINLDIPVAPSNTRLPTEDNGLRVKDFLINYKVREGFQVMAGQFKIPFLRNNLESGFNQLLVDRSVVTALRPAREGSRDVGGMMWGNRGGFQYRAAVFDGSDQEDLNPGGNLRGSGRVSYNWFTPETTPGYTGTTIGEKRILQIGAQGDFQNDRLDSRDDTLAFTLLQRDYRAWAADVFYDQSFGEGKGAFTFEGAWIDREDDYENPTQDTREVDAWYAQTGFLLPGTVGKGRLQLAARYAVLEITRGAVIEEARARTAGINWFGKKHDRKIQLDYTQTREHPTELDDDIFRLSIVASL